MDQVHFFWVMRKKMRSLCESVFCVLWRGRERGGL